MCRAAMRVLLPFAALAVAADAANDSNSTTGPPTNATTTEAVSTTVTAEAANSTTTAEASTTTENAGTTTTTTKTELISCASYCRDNHNKTGTVIGGNLTTMGQTICHVSETVLCASECVDDDGGKCEKASKSYVDYGDKCLSGVKACCCGKVRNLLKDANDMLVNHASGLGAVGALLVAISLQVLL
eukprot:gb/GFBE01032929.1/.p1 GENE.gb/GFBE01032929.1/~~gb/GFBE01032929.1/.p1  ORF type:complete len:187 (+),score=44.55 gb/GFBE01032929.1/:1-561(+)